MITIHIQEEFGDRSYTIPEGHPAHAIVSLIAEDLEHEAEVTREIVFYRDNFERVRSIQITHPVPECWSPPEYLADANAIQAVSNGIVIGKASRIGVSWHYNLVGGPGHLPPVGATQSDSLKEIVTFFAEALLLSAVE